MSASIQDVKAKHQNELMAKPGVVSVGVGRGADGKAAIIVGLDRARPEVESVLPKELDGYPVHVQIVGPLKAQ